MGLSHHNLSATFGEGYVGHTKDFQDVLPPMESLSRYAQRFTAFIRRERV